MEKQLTIFFLCLIFIFSCEKEKSYYDQCSEGDTRCSGNKLEKCTSYYEWALAQECDAFGGECVTEGSSSYCSEIPDDLDLDVYITDWGDEEEEDDENTGSDSSIWPDFNNEDEDVVDEDTADTEIDDDFEDIDIIDEDVVEAVCGNTIVEEGEVCEKGTLKNCIEIDPELYSGGKAFCLDDCSGYNLLTCDEIETGDEN